jgi:hypothetical protein
MNKESVMKLGYTEGTRENVNRALDVAREILGGGYDLEKMSTSELAGAFWSSIKAVEILEDFFMVARHAIEVEEQRRERSAA